MLGNRIQGVGKRPLHRSISLLKNSFYCYLFNCLTGRILTVPALPFPTVSHELETVGTWLWKFFVEIKLETVTEK